jgi:hypothetical protein
MDYINSDRPIYIGIDETRLGFNSSTVITAAFTQNPDLVSIVSDCSLLKSKDFLKIAERDNTDLNFPSYKNMRRNGLMSYRWMRINKGRFKNIQEIQHSYIAFMISSLNFEPENVFVYIDAFENNLQKSKFLIKEILHLNDYLIPEKNIDICGLGDKQVPIINYADLLAFEVGLDNFNKFSDKQIVFPENLNSVPIISNRVCGLPLEFRDSLDTALLKW